MSAGRVVDGCIECPFHGFRFDGAGACVALPAHGTGANARPIPPNLRAPAFHVREAAEAFSRAQARLFTSQRLPLSCMFAGQATPAALGSTAVRASRPE